MLKKKWLEWALARIARLVPVLAAAALVGCADNYPWPRDWPALPENSLQAGCPRLDGLYANRGEKTVRPVYDIDSELSQQLLRVSPKTRGARVQLRQATPDVLEVVVLEADGQEFRRETLLSNRGDFECKAGTLWLREVTTVMKDGTGIGRNTTRFGLSVAADGTLAGQQKMFAAGAVAWLVPIVQTMDSWYRWDKVGMR